MTTDMAKNAQAYFNNTFLDTRKIQVSFAKTLSDNDLLNERNNKKMMRERQRARKHKNEKKVNKLNSFLADMGISGEAKATPAIKESELKQGEKNGSNLEESVLKKRDAPSSDQKNGSKPRAKTSNKPSTSNKRLFVKNIPYQVNKDILREVFVDFGKLSECIVPCNNDGESRGIAFITYEKEAEAAQALSQLDNEIVFGRILHVSFAEPARRDKYAQPGQPGASGEKSSYKVVKKSMFFKNLRDETSWNALFLNPNTVIEYVSKEYGLSKKEMLDKELENPAVKIAIMETKIINETKKWLKNNGVDLSALEESDDRQTVERSDTVILVKNLNRDVSRKKLRDVFQRYGEVEKVLLPPNKALGVIQLKSSDYAENCFNRLSAELLNGQPMYLEFAPKSFIKVDPKKKVENEEFQEGGIPTGKSVKGEGNEDQGLGKYAKSKNSGKGGLGEEAELVKGKTLFVKNFSFASSNDDLFEFLGKNNIEYKTAKIIFQDGKSRGFGFIEFSTDEAAEQAIRKLNGKIFDGHKLEISISRADKSKEQKKKKKNVDQLEASAKVVVRNIDFAATKEEVRELVEQYGEVHAVRMPQKMSGDHKGYAFVEFTSVDEAKNAFEALGSSHLYGRRLVLEYARG